MVRDSGATVSETSTVVIQARYDDTFPEESGFCVLAVHLVFILLVSQFK